MLEWLTARLPWIESHDQIIHRQVMSIDSNRLLLRHVNHTHRALFREDGLVCRIHRIAWARPDMCIEILARLRPAAPGPAVSIRVKTDSDLLALSLAADTNYVIWAPTPGLKPPPRVGYRIPLELPRPFDRKTSQFFPGKSPPRSSTAVDTTLSAPLSTNIIAPS